MLFYDFEVFQYDWLVVIYDITNKKDNVIINDAKKLKLFYEEHKNDIWVGYNSRHYDQFILKGIVCDLSPQKINNFIIVEGNSGWRYSDLFRNVPVNNFDIMTTFHGLKQLEGFMGNMIKESDVDFTINRKLTDDEIEEVDLEQKRRGDEMRLRRANLNSEVFAKIANKNNKKHKKAKFL